MKRTLAMAAMWPLAIYAQEKVAAPPANVSFPSYKSLKFPPLRAITLPKPETFTLANGMRVYLLESHELPLVTGVALVRTGNLFDPADKHGLADITGMTMRSGGTKAKTGDDLDVQLENIAASVESEIGESSGSVSFSCLKENTDEVLGAFHDVLTEPGFRGDKMELAKTQWRSSIARRNDDPGGIASREFAAILYGRKTPYGWDVNYSDIDHIQRPDLLAFYKRYYFPANAMLAVYGDFSAAEMKGKIEKAFEEWNATQPPVPPFPEVEKRTAAGVYLAEKEDVTQTFFEIGTLGGTLKDKDYPALGVAADILGGGFSSRLVKEVRTKLGYAYDINAGWGANYDHPGLFRIAGSTQSKYTDATIEEVKKEIEGMRTAEVTDAELKTAKDSVLNSFVFFFDRPSKTLNRLLTYEYFGYPRGFIFDYQKAVAAVTKADVLRVAREYFHPERLTIVAVGNPKDFGKPLAALGQPVTPIDLTIPEPKKENAKAGPESAALGKKLIARMRAALGGVEKLEAVKDTASEADVEVETGGPAMKIKQKNAFIAPSSLRQDIEGQIGKQSVYSDGKSGWIASAQGAAGIPAPILKQVRGEIFRQLYALALSDKDADRTVTATEDGTLDIASKGGERVSVELDAGTGLPKKIVYDGVTMGGPARVEETLGDWRDVQGLKAPFAMTIEQNGKKFAAVTVLNYKVNSGLSAEEISKKP